MYLNIGSDYKCCCEIIICIRQGLSDNQKMTLTWQGAKKYKWINLTKSLLVYEFVALFSTYKRSLLNAVYMYLLII